MPAWTRRRFLATITAGLGTLAVPTLLASCGQPTSPATSTPLSVPAAGAGTPPRPGPPSTPVSPVAGSPTRPPTVAVPSPTATRASAPTLSPVRVPFGYSCPYPTQRGTVQPEAPYQVHGISEPFAYSFSELVQQYSDLIVLGTVREILPPRWTTADGQRPANPHQGYDFRIVTPVKIAVERVAKGEYQLPSLYFAILGGQIGDDCENWTDTAYWPRFAVGDRTLYMVTHPSLLNAEPEPGYRYYNTFYTYRVSSGGTITIGPRYDITRRKADDLPRTITIEAAVSEIATLLAAPPATPTRSR